MIEEELLEMYYNQYKPISIGYENPSGSVLITTQINGVEKSFIEPLNETDEIFIDRLERSKKDGKNLFLEEWEEFVYEEGIIY